MEHHAVYTVTGGVARRAPNGRWRFFCWHCAIRFTITAGNVHQVRRFAADHVNRSCPALQGLPF